MNAEQAIGLEADIARAEAHVSAALEAEIAPFLPLTRSLMAAAHEALAVMDHTRYEEFRAVHACAIVLVRVLNEMNACLHLVQRGYVMQALSLTAGMLEFAHVIGFIGADDLRATKWAEHDNPAKSYPRIRESIEATAASMGVPTDLATREYDAIYQEMCMAKHGNPIAMGQLGLTVGNEHVHLHVGPYFSDKVVEVARATLGYGVRYTWIATWLFAKHHVEEPRASSLAAQLGAIADAHATLTRADLERFRESESAEDNGEAEHP